MDVATIEHEALQLSEGDRALLVDALMDSLGQSENFGILAAWAGESDERAAAFHQGELETVDGLEVMSRLWAKLER